MRLSILVGALFLCACAGARASLRSPVATAPVLQNPIVTEPAKPAPEKVCRPIYNAPVEHIDSGDDPCPGGVCAVPGPPDLPGYCVPPPKDKTVPAGQSDVSLFFVALAIAASAVAFLFIVRLK